MAMLRHRAAHKSTMPTRLLYSSRNFDEIIYRRELELLAEADPTPMVRHTFVTTCCQSFVSYPSDTSCGQFPLCVFVRCRLTGQQPRDFLSGSCVATRHVNQQSQICRIDRLQPEKIKRQFS